MKKLDSFFNWQQPKQSARNSSLGDKIRLKNVKNKAYDLAIGADLVEKYGCEKVAFAWSGKDSLITFNPADGVPFYDTKKQAHAKAVYIHNKDLVFEMWKQFDLNGESTVEMNVVEFADHNGMKLFKLTQTAS